MGLRVLVSDSNVDAADSLALLLQLWGYRVQVAYSAAATLEMARTGQPDVVLCELLLPGMDGVRLAHGLRAAADDALLIAVTACYRALERSRGAGSPFDYYLLKPAEPGDLLELLAIAGERKSRRATRRALLAVG
jgi:DNA-binding response OmpR family regulator